MLKVGEIYTIFLLQNYIVTVNFHLFFTYLKKYYQISFWICTNMQKDVQIH